MPNTPTVRELRRSARALNIDGWEDMSETELRKAVKAAEAKSATKASTRTSKASKTASKTRRTSKPAVEDDDETPPAKSKSKKTTAKTTTKKAASKNDDVEPAENGNPFKSGTNMFLITEELIKGGKRTAMVARLKKKITLEPRTKSAKDFDVDAEMDRRVLIIGQLLKNEHGFNVVRDGRGPEAHIVAEAP